MGVITFAGAVEQILEPYRERFERAFEAALPRFGCDSKLVQACTYAVRSGGKRLRPALVWMVADALQSAVSVDLAALSVEFFHTASLIADDLPCMDNDDFRRGCPTTHKAFSESLAILASFGLTAAGFEFLTAIEVPVERRESVLRLAVIQASQTMGVRGIMLGQFLDLEMSPDSIEAMLHIFDHKTGILFELCFVLGWLFGGGDVLRLEQIRRLALHFGRAFQILDDIDDLEQDKRAGKQLNYALRFGVRRASEAVAQHVDLFRNIAQELGIDSLPLMSLGAGMKQVGERL